MMKQDVVSTGNGLARAGILDTLVFLTRVALPTFAKGILIRRPRMEAAAQRWGLDTAAVKAMQGLRRKYGTGPLLLPIPLRPQLLLLHPQDVDDVLKRSPVPFATATREKRSALDHFEPGNVLISSAARRAELRPLHDAALEPGSRVHAHANRFKAVIDEELSGIVTPDRHEISWDTFSGPWFRIVRRLVLGDQARDDEAFTDLLNALRGRANWAFFLPKSVSRRNELHERLRSYLQGAIPGTLGARMPLNARFEPTSQVAQWLFAFDPAGMATFRTLALLACHPNHAERVRSELGDASNPHAGIVEGASADRPFARQCFLESLRLWPTTPAILREVSEAGAWPERSVREGTGIIIFTPFFHRDDMTLDFAHRMCPEIWEHANDALPARGLVPFSSGPAICPAHNLVPLLASYAIGSILGRRGIALQHPRLDPHALPGTLDHRQIRIALH